MGGCVGACYVNFGDDVQYDDRLTEAVIELGGYCNIEEVGLFKLV